MKTLVLILSVVFLFSREAGSFSLALRMSTGAFSSAECDKIVAMMKKLPAQRDVRVEEAVSRVNYFDMTDKRFSEGDGNCPYDWIYERVMEHAKEEVEAVGENSPVQWGFDVKASSLATFSRNIEFVLLHEFQGDKGDFFDWHIDTKPGDGTGRTVNINVMLSEVDKDYTGGGLFVGDADVQPKKGDLYWYPANYPHKVGDVTSGTRHTFIVAMKTDELARLASDYWVRAEKNFESICGTRIPARALTTAALPRKEAPPKWHMLRGEHFASQGREDDANDAYADAYGATEQAADYAKKFDEDGQRMVAAGKLKESLGYFKMACRVDPGNALYESHRAAIETAVNSVEEKKKAAKGAVGFEDE